MSGRYSEVTARVRARAELLGFDAIGIARADEPLTDAHDRYRAFVAEGRHGTMEYLAENAEVRRRLDTGDILAGAKSVLCLARRYDRSAAEEAEDSPLARRIARYARGRDYHNGLRKKLRQLAAFLRTLGTVDAPVAARPLCDDAPILERAWAERAGLGFIGKNGLLIVPGKGSFVLLGEVVTTLALDPDTPIRERCGSCTRCLDACPTAAFAAPFVLDPRRCVSYLTIEHEGPIPVTLREGIGSHLFGCDDCQTVCPFNAHGRAGAGPAFTPHERWGALELEDLIQLGEGAFDEVRRGSPIGRPGREGLARNAAIVLGNEAAPTASAVSTLEEAAATDRSPVVQDAARWALDRARRPA